MPAACLSVPPSPARRLRLFCFHHAGGAASVFAGWRTALPAGIDVLPVQLPGRESRRREAVPPDIDSLVAMLDADLADHVRPPYAFYGHSLGGAVAYQLTRRRIADGASAPVALLVGACPAPHLRSALQIANEAGDEALASAMLRIGGLSEEMLRYPEWVRAATNLVRADLRMVAVKRRPEPMAMAIPIHLFHGADDPLVSADQLSAWANYTTAACVLHRIEGGHFFAREPGDEFFRTLANILSPLPEATIR